MSFIEEIRAIARGDSNHLVKQASGGNSLDSLTPAQLNSLAERLEKASQIKGATDKILEMRKQSSQAPGRSDAEMRKLAYRQAMNELGFTKGTKISALSFLFGDMEEAQKKLAQMAVNASAQLIGTAVSLGLEGDQK